MLSDIGRHRIAIAVGRFDPAASREEQPAALADTLFTPPLEYSGPPTDAGFLGISGGDSLQPAWAVPAGPGKWTLRLHETLGRSGVATIHLKKGLKARRVNLQGQAAKGERISGNRIRFSPYKILSVEIS